MQRPRHSRGVTEDGDATPDLAPRLGDGLAVLQRLPIGELVRASFDQVGGGIDYRRWPLTAEGESIYWAGLNKGKRSVAVDLRSDRAKELLTALVADAGTFLTNFPAALRWYLRR